MGGWELAEVLLSPTWIEGYGMDRFGLRGVLVAGIDVARVGS